MSGERRLEMRQIRDAVAGYNGQGVDGLLVRRDREAALLCQSSYS